METCMFNVGGFMKVRPCFVIDALLSRYHRGVRVLIDPQNYVVDRDCKDMMTDLYDGDPARVSVILETLNDLGLCRFDEHGTVTIGKEMRDFLLAGK